jgi:hypothetical protein
MTEEPEWTPQPLRWRRRLLAPALYLGALSALIDAAAKTIELIGIHNGLSASVVASYVTEIGSAIVLFSALLWAALVVQRAR